jgi:hypothetical protein
VIVRRGEAGRWAGGCVFEGDASLPPEEDREGVRCINLLWSAVFSSSLSSSEGASKASWRFRSSSDCDGRRELARERKEGGGESGTGVGATLLWSSSVSCGAICIVLVIVACRAVEGSATGSSRQRLTRS